MQYWITGLAILQGEPTGVASPISSAQRKCKGVLLESRVCNPLGIINCDCKFYDQSTGEVLSCITQRKCHAEILKYRVRNPVGIAYSDCQFHHKYTEEVLRCTIGLQAQHSCRESLQGLPVLSAEHQESAKVYYWSQGFPILQGLSTFIASSIISPQGKFSAALHKGSARLNY